MTLGNNRSIKDNFSWEVLFKETSAMLDRSMNIIDRQTKKISRLDDEIYRLEDFHTALANKRALQADLDILGGFGITETLLTQLISIESNASVVRGLSKQLPLLPGPFDELDVPVSSGLADAEWTGEIAAPTDESSSPFESRLLKPKRLVKKVPVSRKLLRIQTLASGWILNLIGETLGIAEELGFLQGAGTGEPLGVTTDPAVTAITTASPYACQANELAEFCFSLPDRFAWNATIVTTNEFIKWITMHVVDGEGDPIIGPDWNGRLYNVPVRLSDGMPTILSSGDLVPGKVAAVIGDFRQGYAICDGEVAQVDILTELGAATNKVIFLATRWIDGQAIIKDAFTTLKIKAS
jgi:HK97 family phage major capsid protein